MIQNVTNKKKNFPKLLHNWGLLLLLLSLKSIDNTKLFVSICKWILYWRTKETTECRL